MSRSGYSSSDPMIGSILVVWGLCLLGTIAFWGLVAWAIYTLVVHFT